MPEIHERLRWAVEQHAGLSIREFHRRMDERGVRGSSYASVHGYLRGKADPSVVFLQEAADVLGVREPWLVLGSGAPTRREGELAPGPSRPETGREARLRERILSRYPELAGLPQAERDLFFEALTRYVLTAPDAAELAIGRDGSGRILELAGDLLFLLKLPLGPRAWGFRDPEADREAFHHYLTAMLHALELWMEGRGEGRPASRSPASRIRWIRERVEEAEGEAGTPEPPSLPGAGPARRS
jgi:transcriptional regulator with XRE-family HTH domain